MMPYPEDFEEKRKAIRFSNQYLLRFSKHDSQSDEDDEKITGMVHDISKSGIAFWSSQNYSPTDLLDIEIEIFNQLHSASAHKLKMLWSDPITAVVEVLRCERAEAGIFLVVASYKEIAKEHLDALQKSILDQPGE